MPDRAVRNNRSRDREHEHVLIRTGDVRSDGSPARELIPARRLRGRDYLVVGTPALANGCAAGDRIRVEESGDFIVVERGGKVAVQIYAGASIPATDLIDLRVAFGELNGVVEWPAERRFVVVTVPVDVGFAAIERLVDNWTRRLADVGWNYGNIYDDEDRPLNWWT